MVDEKGDPTPQPSNPKDDVVDVPMRPLGWRHKSFRLFGKEMWYASPLIQLLMVSFVCFLCPGMFNALSGMGGGGQVETKPSNDANTALYSTFAVVAFFSGTIANVLGIRLTLSLGGIGYCVYVASFLSYSHTKNRGFVVFAGALLGVCAGLLWTAQGAIIMSYPEEKKKGRYISWFWVIFNFGAVIGSLIPLAQNINNKAGPVTDGTYAGFLVLMFCGALLALCLCNASDVIRDDGTKVILMKNPTWISEFKGLWETLAQDPWIILLFPLFFGSNVFYTYQLNDMNAPHFTTRTRALNSLLYWLAQIIGAMVFGYALDFNVVGRALRAKASLVVLLAISMAIWGGGWAWQKDQVTREEASEVSYEERKLDWTSDGFLGPMFLFFFYGFFDAVWQTAIYWYMGAISNSGRKTANLAGFYKGLQSAGAAVYWNLDRVERPYNTIFTATWALIGAGLLIAAPVIFRIKDTVLIEEDLKFSDEIIADTVVPGVHTRPKDIA